MDKNLDCLNFQMLVVGDAPENLHAEFKIVKPRPKRPKQKFFTLRLFLSLIVLASVFGILRTSLIEQVWPGEKVEVVLDTVRGLKKGAPLLSWPDMNQLGKVISLTHDSDPNSDRVIALLEIDRNQEIVSKIKKKGNDFYVYGFAISESYLKIKGSDRFLNGPALVVRYGPLKEEQTDQFIAWKTEPPMPGIEWNSLKTRIIYERNMHQLEGTAPVLSDRRIVIGQVQNVEELDSGQVAVDIAFRKDREDPRYLLSSTRYYLDSAEVTASGFDGSPKAMFFGPLIVACLDRSPIVENQVQDVFVGQASAPPTYVSRPGEGTLFLDSNYEVPDNIPIYYWQGPDRGKVIGYVVSSEQSIEQTSLFLQVRIYPEYKNLVTDQSKFSLEESLRVQLFNGKPETIMDIGKMLDVIVTLRPKAMFKPGIELFTPPDSLRHFNFEQKLEVRRQQAFFLNDRPEADWRKWKAVTGRNIESEKLPYPTVLQIRISWNDEKKWTNTTAERKGYVTVFEKSLLGSQFSLAAPTDPKVAKNQKFEVIGKPGQLYGNSLGINAFLAKREHSLKGLTPWPKEKMQILKEPKDLYFIPPGSEPKLIDARRLVSLKQGGFKVRSEAVNYDRSWDGLPVMTYDESSGRNLIGVLSFIEVEDKKGDKNIEIVIAEIP